MPSEPQFCLLPLTAGAASTAGATSAGATSTSPAGRGFRRRSLDHEQRLVEGWRLVRFSARGLHRQFDGICLIARHGDLVQWHCDVLFAHAEEAADTDDHGLDGALIVEEDIVDVANILVGGTIDRSADELRC